MTVRDRCELTGSVTKMLSSVKQLDSICSTSFLACCPSGPARRQTVCGGHQRNCLRGGDQPGGRRLTKSSSTTLDGPAKSASHRPGPVQPPPVRSFSPPNALPFVESSCCPERQDHRFLFSRPSGAQPPDECSSRAPVRRPCTAPLSGPGPVAAPSPAGACSATWFL